MKQRKLNFYGHPNQFLNHDDVEVPCYFNNDRYFHDDVNLRYLYYGFVYASCFRAAKMNKPFEFSRSVRERALWAVNVFKDESSIQLRSMRLGSIIFNSGVKCSIVGNSLVMIR